MLIENVSNFRYCYVDCACCYNNTLPPPPRKSGQISRGPSQAALVAQILVAHCALTYSFAHIRPHRSGRIDASHSLAPQIFQNLYVALPSSKVSINNTLKVSEMEPPVHSPLLTAPLAHGDPQQLPPQVLAWLQECVAMCNPKQV